MYRNQDGNAPAAFATYAPHTAAHKMLQPRNAMRGEGLRKEFTVHPLSRDVVRDILACDRQLIDPGNCLIWHHQLARTRASLRVPFQSDRSGSLQPGDQ